MKFSEPFIGMRIGYPGDDGWDGRSGEILELHDAPPSKKTRRGFDKVYVRWNSGSEEWIDTAKLEADPSGPSRAEVRRKAFERIDGTRTAPSAIERWRKDRRANMKAIVTYDIENLALEHERMADANKSEPAHENFKANAELLKLAAKVLAEIR